MRHIVSYKKFASHPHACVGTADRLSGIFRTAQTVSNPTIKEDADVDGILFFLR